MVSLWELSYFVKGMLPAYQGFQAVELLILFQIGIFSWIEETHVSLEWKPSMLDSRASSTLLPYENSVSFLNEYILQLRFFKVEGGSFCYK
jgi:predicted membrane-bound dolichyl-phosphate-mannose-protein mannosyltransferase